MDTLIKFGLFFLGVITSVLLVPMIEKRKSEFQKKESLKELFIELDDIHVELIEHLKSSFQFLLNLRMKTELAENGKLPIPMPKNIDTDVLSELYKQSALILTSSQRLAIKRIPNSINEIMRHSQLSVDSITNEKIYCIQSIKNTVKLTCMLIHELNFLREHRERFVFAKDLNSNTAVLPVLKSIGYDEIQIAQSRVEESEFKDFKVSV
ncbi:hypothetical protein [Pseudoalteromonas piscicida]|uniref:hypothetical protein n=1 Tax=Pseudoalteromonas piscicida TaxID=43662 RepID=UPI0032C1C355